MRTSLIAALCAVCALAPAPAAADVPDDVRLAKVLRLVNKERSEPQLCGTKWRRPAKPLRYDQELSVAAQLHAQDMADNDYFEHSSLDGRSFVDRIQATDYRGDPAGENIASGQQTAREVMRGWMNSPPHCRAIMAKRFDAIGLGLAERDDPRYSEPVTYWVQDFGYDD